MDLSLWRNRSRIVAYVDLVLSSIAMVFSVVVVALGVAVTAVVVDQKDKHTDVSKEEIHAILWLMWVSLAVMLIIISVDLWAAVMLLKATKIGAEPATALHRAKIWRNVNIGFLVFSCVFYGFISQSFLSLAVEIIFRGVLLFIVCKFIAELGRMTGFVPDLDFVVVKH